MEGEKYKLKMAVISGASHALKFKDENPKATTQKIMQDVTDNAEEIIKKIDEDEED